MKGVSLRLLVTVSVFIASFFVFSGQMVNVASAEAAAIKPDDVQNADSAKPRPNGSALNDKLEKDESIKDAFGGVWIDDDAKVNVGLVRTGDTVAASRQAILDAAAELGMSKDVNIVPVDYSWTTLMQTTEAISRLHQQHVDYKHGAWPIQMGIKTDVNKVQVDIPADSTKLTSGHREVLSEIEKYYKDRVFYETYDKPAVTEAECNWWYCDSPLRGGVGIKRSVDSSGGVDCTAGFAVKGVSSGRPYILTAGHCTQSSALTSTTWRTETYSYTPKNIGNTILAGHSIYYNPPIPLTPLDAEIILVDDYSYWSPIEAILKRSGNTGSLPAGSSIVPVITYTERYSIPGYGGNVVGDMVCISPAMTGGYTTPPNGGSCGKVQQVWVSLTPANNGITTYVNRASYCSRGGDSGAPIYYRDANQARGIHRAAAGETVCSDSKYFTPMNMILEWFSQAGHSITLN